MTIFIICICLAALAWYFFERGQRKTKAMSGGLHESILLPHEQAWELYHNDFSLCSKKMRVVLSELNIDYKAHHIDLIETGAYENIGRKFLKVNPGAIVPVLVHNGHPIYESHDQLAYAAVNSTNPDLLIPTDPNQRTLMETWVYKTSLIGDDPIAGMQETMGNAVPGLTLPIFATMIESISVASITEGLLFHRFKQRALLFLMLKLRGPKNLPNIKPMVKVIHRSFKATQLHLAELEACLANSKGPYITGDQFTLADVGMMVIFDRLEEADWMNLLVTDNLPLIKVYARKLKQRPSHAAAITAHTHPTVSAGHQRIVELKQSDPGFQQIYTTAAE